MRIRSKVFACSQRSLESRLSQWLGETPGIEVLHMTQSQSWHGEPGEPSAADKGLHFHTAGSVTLTVIYRVDGAGDCEPG